MLARPPGPFLAPRPQNTEIEVEHVNDCTLEQVAWPIKTVNSKTMRGGGSTAPASSPASASGSFPGSLLSGLLG
jgi:hypothetical protein